MVVDSLTSTPVAVAIQAWTLGFVEKKVAGMAKRAARLGKDPITLEVGETFTQKVAKGRNMRGDMVYVEQEMVNVTVKGQRAVFNGWKPIANLVKVGDQNVIRSSEEGLEEYRDRVNICEHCGTHRHRKETWVLRHEETGELKQIARSCLQDFLGVSDVDLKQIESWASFVGFLQDPDMPMGSKSKDFSVLTYMAATATIVRVDGWVSKAVARDTDKFPTASVAESVMHGLTMSEEDRKKQGIPTITPEDWEVAQKALTWIRDPETLKNSKGNYLYNCVVACRPAYAPLKLSGIIASVVGVAYPNAMKRAEEQKAAQNEQVSKHVGQLKKRQVFSDVTVTRVTSWFDEYAEAYRSTVNFKDTEGNLLKWRASKDVSDTFNEGETVTIKGTPTYHGTDKYSGQACTWVNRVAKQ